MGSGIYIIQHCNSSKMYVGSSSNIAKRWCRHRSLLNHGQHPNSKLQCAWKKYGYDAFEFSVILECASDRMLIHEQGAMDHLKPWYNIMPVAGSNLGMRHSVETRAKISASHIGKPHPLSPETRAKISASGKGRPCSVETRAKQSMIRKGRIVSADTRLKMSLARIGKKRSPETIAKMSAARRGISLSINHRHKLSRVKMGHAVSLETRAKLALATKRYYELRKQLCQPS